MSTSHNQYVEGLIKEVTEAAKALFDLTTKRDATYKLSTSTGTSLINEILFSRRIELWGEGHQTSKSWKYPTSRHACTAKLCSGALYKYPHARALRQLEV